MMDAVIDEIDGRMIRIGDHWLADFASCNYLGFDLDPEIIDAIDAQLDAWGTHPSWSRLLGSPGSTRRSRSGSPRCSARRLARPADHHAHPHVRDPAARRLGHDPARRARAQDDLRRRQVARARGAAVKRFRFDDPDHLDQLLRAERDPTRLVCIDGVNSMTGNAPDIRAFAAVARKHGALLYVDDAHGFGVIGERRPDESSTYGARGNSVVRHCDETYDDIVLVGGFSKAYSSLLAFIACPTEVKDLLKVAAAAVPVLGAVAGRLARHRARRLRRQRAPRRRAAPRAARAHGARARPPAPARRPHPEPLGLPDHRDPAARPRAHRRRRPAAVRARRLRDARGLPARAARRGRLPRPADRRQHRRRDRHADRRARGAGRRRRAAHRRGRRLRRHRRRGADDGDPGPAPRAAAVAGLPGRRRAAVRALRVGAAVRRQRAGLQPARALAADRDRHRPPPLPPAPRPGPWRWFAIGFLLFWLGDLYTYSYPRADRRRGAVPVARGRGVRDRLPRPDDGPADPRPAAQPGARPRRGDRLADHHARPGADLVDRADPAFPARRRSSRRVAKLVSIAYPIGDILLLAAAIRLAVDTGTRRPAFYLLVSSIVALLATDFAYGLVTLAGAYDGQVWLDVGWISFYLLWGAAALHPSMADLDQAAPGPRPAPDAAAARDAHLRVADRPGHGPAAGHRRGRGPVRRQRRRDPPVRPRRGAHGRPRAPAGALRRARADPQRRRRRSRRRHQSRGHLRCRARRRARARRGRGRRPALPGGGRPRRRRRRRARRGVAASLPPPRPRCSHRGGASRAPARERARGAPAPADLAVHPPARALRPRRDARAARDRRREPDAAAAAEQPRRAGDRGVARARERGADRGGPPPHERGALRLARPARLGPHHGPRRDRAGRLPEPLDRAGPRLRARGARRHPLRAAPAARRGGPPPARPGRPGAHAAAGTEALECSLRHSDGERAPVRGALHRPARRRERPRRGPQQPRRERAQGLRGAARPPGLPRPGHQPRQPRAVRRARPARGPARPARGRAGWP